MLLPFDSIGSRAVCLDFACLSPAEPFRVGAAAGRARRRVLYEPFAWAGPLPASRAAHFAHICMHLDGKNGAVGFSVDFAADAPPMATIVARKHRLITARWCGTRPVGASLLGERDGTETEVGHHVRWSVQDRVWTLQGGQVGLCDVYTAASFVVSREGWRF